MKLPYDLRRGSDLLRPQNLFWIIGELLDLLILIFMWDYPLPLYSQILGTVVCLYLGGLGFYVRFESK